MALTFEFEQKIADGTGGIALEYPGEVVQAFGNDGSGNLQGAVSKAPGGDFSALSFDSVGICAKQAGVEYASLHMYSTDGIYGTWLFGDKQQLVIFLLEFDISTKLKQANISYDTTNPVTGINLSFVETIDMLLEDQRSLLDPGARIRLRFQAGDSDFYPMGMLFVDRSSGQDLDKNVRLEGRGIIGKPLQDQSFDENYDYPYDAATDVIISLLENAGYTEDQYMVETTAAEIGMTFDRKKKFYSGLQEILDSLGWQIKESPEGYLIIGSSTYEEFDTPSDYEFEYGSNCYSRGFTNDDSEAYTRVCVHTQDYSVAVYEAVEIYTSWAIGEQKTFYFEVADGTSEASATAIAADLAVKFSNSGTIESFSGPFRPYIIPGDTAKITKDGIERTVGIITNIKHVMGKDGFATEFDVDSGGVAGVGRMKDYIKGLQRKQTDITTRSYS